MYTQPLIKLTIGGSVAGQDIWTNQLHIASLGDDITDAQELFNEIALDGAIKDAVAAAYTGVGGITRYLTLEWIKVSLIDTNGLLVGEPKYYDYPAPIAGGSTINVPPQDSIVVTLTTLRNRGLAYKGRIFLPAGFADVQGLDGRLTSTQTNSIATRFKTFFDALETYLDTMDQPGRLVVASDVREGATWKVVGLQVGNLVDTQRRRRNRLSESYAAAELARP